MLRRYIFTVLLVAGAINAYAQEGISSEQLPHARSYLSLSLFSGETGLHQSFQQQDGYDWVQPLLGYNIGIGKRSFLSPHRNLWMQWGIHYGSRRFVANAPDSVTLWSYNSIPAHEIITRENYVKIPISFHATGRINQQFSLIGFVGTELDLTLFGQQTIRFSNSSEGLQTLRGNMISNNSYSFVGFKTGLGLLWNSEKNLQVGVTPYLEYGVPIFRNVELPSPWFAGVRTSLYFSLKR